MIDWETKIENLENLVVENNRIPKQKALEYLREAEEIAKNVKKYPDLYSRAVKLIIFIKGIIMYEKGVRYKTLSPKEFGSISRILLEEVGTISFDALKEFLLDNGVYNETELLQRGIAKIKIEEVS